jgi:ankyrin repeat protein
VEAITALVMEGANLLIRDIHGDIPAEVAKRNGHVKAWVKITDLEDYVVDVNKRDDDGFTPLMRAAVDNQLDAIRQLIETRGADVNMFGKYTADYAISLAVQEGHVDAIVLLAEHGAHRRH